MKNAFYFFVAAVLIAALPVLGGQGGPDDFIRKAQLEAQKEMAEKNFRELKEAASQLAALTKELSGEIDKGSEHVISARVFDRLDKIEQLTKRIRDKAKGP
jgi:hypothetical protein